MYSMCYLYRIQLVSRENSNRLTYGYRAQIEKSFDFGRNNIVHSESAGLFEYLDVQVVGLFHFDPIFLRLVLSLFYMGDNHVNEPLNFSFYRLLLIMEFVGVVLIEATYLFRDLRRGVLFRNDEKWGYHEPVQEDIWEKPSELEELGCEEETH